MSSTAKNPTFSERRSAPRVGLGMLRELIDFSAEDENEGRSVLCIVGVPGIGKSQVVAQAAKDRKDVPFLLIEVPNTNPHEWGLPFAGDDKGFYDLRLPAKFKPLIEYVEAHCARIREEYKGKPVPIGLKPIVMFEEVNRGVGQHVTRALFTAMEARVIGDWVMDPMIQIICSMNPNSDGASVLPMDDDPAHRRRLSFVEVTYNAFEWARYAEERNYDPAVVEYIRQVPAALYDEDAMRGGKLYGCPASWQTVSGMCKVARRKLGLGPKDPLPEDALLGTMVASKINIAAKTRFFAFTRDQEALPGVLQVCQHLTTDTKIVERVQGAIAKKQASALAELITGIAKYLSGDRPPIATVVPSLAKLAHMLVCGGRLDEAVAEDLGSAFMLQYMADAHDGSSEGQQYLHTVRMALNAQPPWREAMSKLHGLREAAKVARVKKEGGGSGAPGAN